MSATEGILDLGTPFFWVLLLISITILRILNQRNLRTWAFATLNLVCLFWLGRWVAVGFALILSLGGTLFAWSIANRHSRIPKPLLPLFPIVVLSTLFIIHKRSDSFFLQSPTLKSLKLTMAVCGFSYIFLRIADFIIYFRRLEDDKINPIHLLNYFFPFHMLAAGPIQSWNEYRKDLKISMHDPTFDEYIDGLEILASGIFKKFVISQALQILFLSEFQTNGFFLFIEIQAHYLWIFLDFSAYSDIALGAGRLMGISTPQNFRKPLLARNIIDFWERWHISLSSFVRRNIFSPTLLRTMRKFPKILPLSAGIIALIVSFSACGLWHGLTHRFIIWGFMHATAVTICYIYQYALQRKLGHIGLVNYLARPWVRTISTVITFEFVALSLAFVRHPYFRFLD